MMPVILFWSIVAIVSLCGVYDACAWQTGNRTVSEEIQAAYVQSPWIAFLTGMLMGHLFLPLRVHVLPTTGV